jgi:predicted DNA-binding transcriptional regulator AlpA
MIENEHSADSSTARSGEALLISAEELANLLGISKRQVWRLLSRGDLIKPIKSVLKNRFLRTISG